MRNFIKGEDFINKMVEIGLLPSDKAIQKVIIEADAEGVVIISLQYVGEGLILDQIEPFDR